MPSRVPHWFKIAFAVLGWVVAAFLGLLDLPGKVNAFFKEYPKATENVATWWNLNKNFTGTWTSDIEGDIASTDEDRRLQGGDRGPVVIKMRVYGGFADGEIYSEGLKNSYVASRIFLKGETDGSDHLDAFMYDYIGGEPKNLALLRFAYANGFIQFKTVKQGGPFLPEEAKLHRDGKAMPDTLGGLSPWWMNTLLDYVKKQKELKNSPTK